MRYILWAVSFLVAFGAYGPIKAESPPPFPQFESKRLKPPAPGVKKRIQVQITPQDSAIAAAAPVSVSSGGAAKPALYDWFWEAILPQDNQTGPGRLADALETLSTPVANASLAPPRLQDLQDIASEFGIDMMLATVGKEVSPALVLALIHVESSGRSDAESSAGAQGLMQLMPATAERFEVKNPLDPKQSIQGGVAYLDFLMKEFGGDPILALAGYNAGENAVHSNDGVPPYTETRNYVPRVLSAFRVAKGLCVTPPLLASDGCVFANLSN